MFVNPRNRRGRASNRLGGRPARAAAGGLLAGVLAVAMATGINLGILGAAGNPSGPGTLGSGATVAFHTPPERSALPGGAPGDRPPVRHPVNATRHPSTAAPPSPSGVKPGSTPGSSWTRSTSPPGASESEHRFGAGNDD